MKEQFFLCLLKWDAQQHREVVSAKSKGYDTIEQLLTASAPWIATHLGRKMFIQKWHV